MLNPSFSQKATKLVKKMYTLPKFLALKVQKENTLFDTFYEYRTQTEYTDELWLKMKNFNIQPEDLEGKKILDLCSGAGFLSYHLLKRCTPEKIVMAEISEEETRHAKKLLSSAYPRANIEFINSDVLKIKNAANSFDYVIGNSFLHHLYDLEKAANKFKSYLKKGGIFISLHEPTPAAIAVESGSLKNVKSYIKDSRKYLKNIRYKGEGMVDPNFGGDVWLFEAGDLKKVFINAGFYKAKEQGWNFARPLIVAKKNLHLSKAKNKLSKKEKAYLKFGIYLDKAIFRKGPNKYLGSVAIKAEKSK